MRWTVETLDELVDRELEAIPRVQRARFVRIAELIETKGLEWLREPHVMHLEGALWEIRIGGKGGIARAHYVVVSGRRVVVVRVFAKKFQKTSRREILLALKRAKELV